MPNVHYKGTVLECKTGAKLRNVLLKNGLTPHNDSSRYLNCRGLGTCGTCAVKITGHISKMQWREKQRLSFPPHHLSSGLRLACQTEVHGDVQVEKGEGFWGQKARG
jgi:ferredoxin